MTGIVINIDVPSLKAGIQFYTTAFECDLRRMLFDGAVAELILGDRPIYLIEQHEGTRPYPGAAKVRSYARHWTPVHLDVVVDDLHPALERAVQAGAFRTGEVSTDDWGRLAPLADPFGHGICLVEFSERGYDAVAEERP